MGGSAWRARGALVRSRSVNTADGAAAEKRQRGIESTTEQLCTTAAVIYNVGVAGVTGAGKRRRLAKKKEKGRCSVSNNRGSWAWSMGGVRVRGVGRLGAGSSSVRRQGPGCGASGCGQGLSAASGSVRKAQRCGIRNHFLGMGCVYSVILLDRDRTSGSEPS